MSTNDYRSYSNYPLGIRNNNPGNIRPGDNWVGMVGTNKNFIVFKDIHHGLRALAIDLSNKIHKGYNTIQKIIERYAPPSENNTPSYVQAVSLSTGIGSQDKLTANFDTLKKLMRAVVSHENGKAMADSVIKDSDLEKGIALMPQSITDRVKDFFQNNPNVTAAVGHVRNNGLLYAGLAIFVVIVSFLYAKSKRNG